MVASKITATQRKALHLAATDLAGWGREVQTNTLHSLVKRGYLGLGAAGAAGRYGITADGLAAAGLGEVHGPAAPPAAAPVPDPADRRYYTSDGVLITDGLLVMDYDRRLARVVIRTGEATDPGGEWWDGWFETVSITGERGSRFNGERLSTRDDDGRPVELPAPAPAPAVELGEVHGPELPTFNLGDRVIRQLDGEMGTVVHAVADVVTGRPATLIGVQLDNGRQVGGDRAAFRRVDTSPAELHAAMVAALAGRQVEQWPGPMVPDMVVAESDSGQLCEMPRVTFRDYDGMGWHLFYDGSAAELTAPADTVAAFECYCENSACSHLAGRCPGSAAPGLSLAYLGECCRTCAEVMATDHPEWVSAPVGTMPAEREPEHATVEMIQAAMDAGERAADVEHPIGSRVEIVKAGPDTGRTGEVVALSVWTGDAGDRTVRLDDTGERLVFQRWMLSPAPQRTPFDEDDVETWAGLTDEQLPAGYAWREVSEGELHLFSPDGRNLTAAWFDRAAALRGDVPVESPNDHMPLPRIEFSLLGDPSVYVRSWSLDTGLTAHEVLTRTLDEMGLSVGDLATWHAISAPGQAVRMYPLTPAGIVARAMLTAPAALVAELDEGTRAEVGKLRAAGIPAELADVVAPASWTERADEDAARPCGCEFTECQWFALCDRLAVTTMPHPVLGDVPICRRCVAKVNAIRDAG